MSAIGNILFRPWVTVAIRVVIGGILLYAGVLKMQSPLNFADSIASFRILPPEMINVAAMTLPPFEIIVGLMLIVGWRKREAALAVLLLAVVFGIALVLALARGLDVDCGCFGSGEPSVAKTWMSLGRDILMFAGAAHLYANALMKLEAQARWSNISNETFAKSQG